MSKAARVGIVGGLGPQATVDLMQRVIDLTPARDDSDHVHMLVDNDPKVPSRIAALIDMTGPSPGPYLSAMVGRLVAQDVDYIAMPCNTAHFYLPEMRAAAGEVDILDMISLAVRDVQQKLNGQSGPVGLLASTAVFDVGLYKSVFAEVGLQLKAPAYQASVLEAIKAIKAGDLGTGVLATVQAAADDLKAQGCAVTLVACTELSVIRSRVQWPMDVVDSLDSLAMEIVRRA